MHRQVGDLKVNRYGLAERGLLIRHRVLPQQVAGSQAVLRFIAEEISRNSYVNIMDQYRPAFKAHDLPGLARRITLPEYHAVLRATRAAGLWRGLEA